MLDPSLGMCNKFAVKNIYVFSPTLHIDDAWVDVKDSLEKRSTKECQFQEHEQMFSKDLEQALSSVYTQLSENSISKKHDKEK